MAFILDVKVVPSAGFTRCKWEHGRLKCYLISAPEQGKANKELIELFAKFLSLPKSQIVIVSGEKNRTKRLSIDANISLEVILKKFGIAYQQSLFKKD